MDTFVSTTSPLMSTSAEQFHTNRVTSKDVWVLLILLIVGGLLRFYRPEVIDWSNDHSDIALLAQDFAYGEGIPLLGQPSSAIIPFSPVFVYLSVIPFSITDNPILASMVSAFFNLIGVAIVWLIGLRYFGRVAALVAGIAYAVNPWVLGYSRSIWSGDHRAMFVALGVLLGLLGFYEGKRWAQVLCLPILLIGVQTHYAAYTLLPLYLFFLWIGRDRISWQTMLGSLALGAMVLLPYALGIFMMFVNDGMPISGIRPQPREFSFREIVKPYGHMFWLATGTGTELYSARENAAELQAQAPVPTIFWIIEAFAVVLGLISLWLHHPRKIAGVLSLWAMLTVLLFTVPIIGVYPHYFIPVIPALSLLTGIGVAWLVTLSSRRSTILMAGVWGIYGVLFVTQAIFWFVSIEYLDTHFTPSQFGFGTPVHYLMNVKDELKEQRNIVFIANDDWLDFSRTGSHVFAPFLRSTATCLRDVKAGSGVAVLPDEPFAAVFAPRATVDGVLDELYRSENATTVALRPDEGVYEINRFDSTPEWTQSPITAMQPVSFAHGVQLTGYHLEPDQLLLRWLLPQKTEDSYINHVKFFDAENNLLAESEEEFWPGKNWCEGDQLISWMNINIPEQANVLRVGLVPKSASGETPETTTDLDAVIHLEEK